MQFHALSNSITNFIHEISIACHNSRFVPLEKKELLRATLILQAVNTHIELLQLLGKMHRSDFIDSIKIHSARYVKQYSKYDNLKNDVSLFENQVKEFLDHYGDTNRHCETSKRARQFQEVLHDYSQTSEIATASSKSRNDDFLSSAVGKNEDKLESLKERFFKIIQKVQLFFSNQIQTRDALEYIHATSIISRAHVDIAAQDKLIDLLVLVKELWSADYKATQKEGEKKEILSIGEKFYAHPESYIKVDDGSDTKTIFGRMLDLLTVQDHSVLIDLRDEQILPLYDRLKNHEGNSDITEFLIKLHAEAHFRYSYSRLSDVGYQLLNRLQSFDAICHNIENLEFYILESYLFKKNHFAREILINIAKHVDNIKALSLNKNEDLKKILDYIWKSIQADMSKNDNANAIFTVLKDNLHKMMHSHIKRRYVDLDKFTITVLQNKYRNLFDNILVLFEGGAETKEFLHNTLTARLTSDYYLPNLSNSIAKLRIMALERMKVFNILHKIDFLAIFEPGSLGKIKSFSFRKKFDNADLKTAIEYVASVINDIALHASAFQLEILYKLAKEYKSQKQSQETEIEDIMLDAVKMQIKQRATIRNMVYSIISGRKKEYDKLKSLKKMSIKEGELV